MKNMLLIVMLSFLTFLCNEALAQQIQPVSATIRVGMIVFDGEPVFNTGYCQSLADTIAKEISPHYKSRVDFTLSEMDAVTFRKRIGSEGEAFFDDWIADNDVDLLLVNEFSSDRSQITYKAYHKNGMLDVYYLPYEPALLPSITDISVGRYLNLIEGLDGRLHSSQLL
ncbi:MAG: hypothetical protein C0615_01270 [Desulfuromonas sp.]|nr:MAG: hypothetical protein C0615_01270 [Desulfuromonas sp.]